jgi:hypothetical protein
MRLPVWQSHFVTLFGAYLGTPPCRVQLIFEPACAGWVQLLGSALAKAYRVAKRR